MGFVEYNANVRGKNVGDCVKRAISTAYNISYRKVSKDLADISRRLNGCGKKVLSYACPIVYCKLLDKYGTVWSKTAFRLFGEREVSVADFAKEFDGTYVVECGLFSERGSSHLTCVTNHTVYDSYYCGNMRVSVVYKVSDRNLVQTNVEDSLPFGELELLASDVVSRSLSKSNADWKVVNVRVLPEGGKVRTFVKVYVNGKLPSSKPYFDSVVPVPPFVSMDDFLEEYKTITSRRLYSWTLNIRKEFK